MPRTVEHIVACHQHAAELRAAGKRIWNGTVNVKQLLAGDKSNVSPEYIADLAQRLGALLRSQMPRKFFDVTDEAYSFDFEEVVEMLEGCTVESLAEDLRNGCDAQMMFNGWLEQVYDFADRNRIWMGP